MRKSLAGHPLEVTDEVSRRFANMSFICALLVVLIHCSCSPRTDVPYLICRWLSYDGICRIAIPWFSFAAGYFLVSHIGESRWYLLAVAKRTRTLLVPYWLWFAIGSIVAPVILHSLLGHPVGLNCVNTDILLQLSGFHPSSGCGMLWYLRTLFLVCLVLPVFIKIRWGGWLLCCGGYVAFQIWSFPTRDAERFFEYFLSLRVLAYVVTGSFVRLGLLKWASQRMEVVVVVIGVLASCVKMIFLRNELYYPAGICEVIMLPGLIVLVYAIGGRLRLPRLLTSFSFPIYMIHVVILRLIRMCYFEIHGLRAVACFTITAAASIGISYMIYRFMPRFGSLLFGNRLK